MVVRIVTDSTADLPKEVAQELGITVVPLTVFFGDDAYLDGVELDNAGFYARLVSSKDLPRTSQPSPAAFQTAFQQLIDEGADGILVLTLAIELSGTFQSARTASTNISTQVPIEVIDSRSVSAGMGYIVMQAARLAREGQDLTAIKTYVEDVCVRTSILAVLDTLEYLKRGGRIGAASAMLGNMLSFKPIISVKDGTIAPLERPRTRSKAFARAAQLLSEMGELEHVSIVESDDEAGAQLSEAVRTVYSGEVPRYKLAGVIGAHAGPGVAGLAVVTAKK